MTRRLKNALLGVVAVAALALAACGSDSPVTKPTTSSGGASSSTSASSTVSASSASGEAVPSAPAAADLTAVDGGKTLERLRKQGYAIAATPATPPYVSLSPDGKPIGYNPDVAKEALRRLGVPELRGLATTYDVIIPGLQAGQFDLLPSALSITAERCKQIVFSNPVSVEQQGLTVLKGNPKGVVGYESFVGGDLTLAVLAGGRQESYAHDQGVPSDKILQVPDLSAGIAAVTSGRADAFGTGQFAILFSNFDQSKIEVVVDQKSPISPTGVGFRADDIEFRDAFNLAMDQMRDDGTLEQLYSGTYGFPNYADLEGARTAQMVPGCS
ncbi:MAG: transporter substrate-binding domain-containing protein [Ilumatobacteraceae bacterium]